MHLTENTIGVEGIRASTTLFTVITMRSKKVCLLCLLLLFLSTAAYAKIVFYLKHEGLPKGQYEIYVMDDDGSNQKLLAQTISVNGPKLRPCCPTWSPDGQQILFQRRFRDTFKNEKNIFNRIEGDVLFLMNKDGTNVRQLTENDGSSIGRGSFSPDGKTVVFKKSIRINGKLRYGISVLNIETGTMKEIASQVMASFCDWSPDGKHIIYSAWHSLGGGVNGTIWIMDADGHNPHPLIPAPPVGKLLIHRSMPRWSPDGKHIVFSQEEYTWEKIHGVGTAKINLAYRYMICDRNGENIKKLQIAKDSKPYSIDWMDDGESIVFSAHEGIPLGKPIPRDFVYPPYNIYKYHIATGEITRLTNHQGKAFMLDWISNDVLSVSPEGKKRGTWGKLKKQYIE